MSQIESVHARQILDSRGNPTVEVEVTLRSGAHGFKRQPDFIEPSRRRVIAISRLLALAHRVDADLAHGLSHPAREVLHEMGRQRRHVRLPLAQRRQVDREDVQPIQQVLPERPALYIVCGGGRLNAAIMGELEALAAAQGAQVTSAEQAGFDGDAMEAEAWAYLAVRSMDGLPLTFPGTTGVTEPVTGGVLAKPGAE